MNNTDLLDRDKPRYTFILSGLMLLFLARVVGQALVAFWNVPFLPPMEEWFSGLLPYPELLTCQIVILVVGSIICWQFAVGRGFFVVPRARLGRFLLHFGSIYLIVMIMRYVIRMSLYPDQRWFGGTIPIFFHWVLAGFVLVLGFYHWNRSRQKLSSRVAQFVPSSVDCEIRPLHFNDERIQEKTDQ